MAAYYSPLAADPQPRCYRGKIMPRLLLTLFIGISLFISNTAFSNDIVTFDGCEYTVIFPIRVKLTPVHTSGIESVVAITSCKDGMPILRAECQPLMEGAKVSNDMIVSTLEEQALSIGLTNVQVIVQTTDIGIVGTFFGKKIAGGFEMAQMGKLYVGERSILNLLSTEPLSKFPSKKTNIFFGSVRKK